MVPGAGSLQQCCDGKCQRDTSGRKQVRWGATEGEGAAAKLRLTLCELRGRFEWMRRVKRGDGRPAAMFHASCKPRELFRHLLLMQKHARDAVPDT